MMLIHRGNRDDVAHSKKPFPISGANLNPEVFSESSTNDGQLYETSTSQATMTAYDPSYRNFNVDTTDIIRLEPH